MDRSALLRNFYRKFFILNRKVKFVFSIIKYVNKQVLTRLTCHCSCLYYACHVTSTSGNVFDVNNYVIIFPFTCRLCRCNICSLYFQRMLFLIAVRRSTKPSIMRQLSNYKTIKLIRTYKDGSLFSLN